MASRGSKIGHLLVKNGGLVYIGGLRAGGLDLGCFWGIWGSGRGQNRPFLGVFWGYSGPGLARFVSKKWGFLGYFGVWLAGWGSK